MSDVVKQIIYARIKGVNTSDSMYNATVELADSTIMNVKTNQDLALVQGRIYKLEIAKQANSERNVAFLVNATSLVDLTDLETVDKVYRSFDNRNPISRDVLVDEITSYINKIDNKILFDITNNLINENKNKFYLYPAASRLHHAYVGGLAYHTLGMLKQCDSFIENYSYLNKDYLYAGCILHDLGKIIEFSGIENTEYALEGQLLGHLVIGAEFIHQEAIKLGVEKSQEVLLLEHMVISHHGQPNFGACKRPQTAEALVLWYIDTLDSKLRVLGEQLDATKEGEFTEAIGVLEKTRFYKHN
ncbi:MAG: HD domain-containing protein [Acholeplasmatales bacterium]|nr:HD domain-containing protein [Acholeplasmatales bacterium]